MTVARASKQEHARVIPKTKDNRFFSPTDVSDYGDEIGFLVNPSHSSKPIPRDDGAISSEPIRDLSTVTTKPVSNNP